MNRTNCAEEQSRTADTRIFSPLLYHLSYLGSTDILRFPRSSVKDTSFDHPASPEGC
jgi:hypothetical protein